MTKWRDEHPDRYGRIELGDYCGVTELDGSVHFARMNGPGIEIEDHYACGRRTSDWRNDPGVRARMPIAGVVDCEGCLAAMAADLAVKA